MLLTLWCKEGVGQTFDYSNVQDIHVYPSSADEYNVSYTRLPAYSNNNIISCLGDFSTFYIRWYAADDNFNVTSWVSLGFDAQYNIWPFTKLADNSYVFYYPGTDLYGDAANLGNGSSNDPLVKYLLNIHVTSSSGVLNTFSDVVVCEVSDEAYNSSSENRVKIRVIYHFQEKKVEDNFSNVPSDISPIEKEFALYEALSPTSASIALNGATDPSYIRWYFADASGNAVANPGFNLTNGSYTYTSQGNSIYYGGATTDTDGGLLNMTVTPQNGKSWSDLTSYKLVALLSNAEGTVTDGTLTQEPLIATKYEISFDYVIFASALPSNQHTLNIEVTEANAQTATISLSEQWEQIKSDLGAETVSYMKYYWLDEKTGSLTGSVSFSEHPLAGMYWLKPVDTSFSTDMLNFTASVTSGVITDYKLVILLSDEAAAYDENSTWVKEPTLQSMYTVGFYAPRTEFDGSLVSGGISEKVEVTYEYGATKVLVGDANDATDTYSLVYDWGQNTNSIQSLFNYITQSGSGWSTNVYYPNYRRAYVRYKSSQELLANQSDWLTWTPYYLNDDTQFNYNALFYNEKGEFWTKSYAQYRQGDDGNNWEWAWFNGAPSKSLLAVTVNLPEGTDLTFEDIEVVVILAKKDAEREIHSSDVHTVELGPDGYEVEYIYSFKEGNAPFENVPEGITDYPGSKSINWLTTQPMAISLADYCTADGGQPDITYVRYLLTDKSGNEVPWNNAGVTLTAPDGHSFTAQGNSQYIYQATATSDLLTVNLQATTLANLQNYNLKAYVSAQTEDIAITQREPQIEAVYTVSFDAVTFENTVSATEYKTIDIYEEQSYTTISVDLGGTAPTYVRWYWWSDGSNNVAQTDWKFDNTAVAYSEYNGTMYHYAGTTPNEELNKLTITPPVGTDAKDLPLTNLKLVALVSTKTVDDGAQTTTVDEQIVLVKEPLIDKKYIISFASVLFEKSNSIYNATKKEDVIYVTDEQKNGNVSVTVELDENLPTILSTFYKNNATDLDAGFYLRWYIVDGSGNRVTDLTGWSLSSANDGVTYTVNNYGHYWYSALNTSIKVSENQNLMNLVVKSPSDTDLTSYKAVCVMSANLNDATVIEGNLVSEPTWTLQYTYSFASLTFEGSTIGAQSLSETIRLEDDAMSSVTLSLPLSSVQNYMANEASSFYIRYYLTDKSGNRIALPDGVTITPTDNNITLTSNNYGHYWYSSTGIGSITDLKVTVAAANGTVDLRNYNVVAVMSSKEPLEASEGVVTYEPREMEVVYTYELKKPISNDFDGNLASGGIRVQKLIPYEEGTTSITLTNVRDDWDKLKDLFEPSKNYYEYGTDVKTPRYRRVFARNKQTGEILDWIAHTDGQIFNLSENGHIWTAKYDLTKNYYVNYYRYFDSSSVLLTTTIKVPDGSSLSLLDVEVVFILAQGDAREENTDTWTITKGPEEHEVEYIFSFISEKYLPFVHYKGVTGRDWVTVSSNPLLGKFENQAYDATTDETTVVKDDIRQGTHEWTYEIYVKPGAKKSLMLPIQRVIDYGNDLEPQGYFRWYNWNTDFESDNIKPYNANNTSKPKLEKRFYQIIDKIDKVERSRGLIAWWWGNKQTNATANNVAAVNYKAPESGWEGETIACDVSKYIDGLNIVTENNQTSIDFVHEPTLSYRYKYIVRPASVIADKIVVGVKGGNRALYEEELLENHGNVTLAVAPTGESYNPYKGTTTLRLNLSDVNNYYFYPYDAVKKTWDKTDNKIYEATSITWVMYDASGNKLKDLTPMDDNTFCKVTYTNNGPKIGELFYVIAFAANESYSAPIAKFNCKFVDNSHPILFDAGSNGEAIPDFRTIDYLEENYTRVALISFDIEEGSTLTAPTDQIDNTNPFPFAWNRSFYGYCYPQLYGDMAGHAADYAGLGTLHGDYRLVKKAWDGTFAYTELWHAGKGLLDRTNDLTDGVQSGYFLYVDASDESRPIANVQFEGDMCVGSTVVLSAAVADMTSNATVHPQLMFKLYGIHLDADGNETERKLIHSFATADFSTLGCGAIGEWYQTYAKITLRGNSGVENYQNFLVSIDNYCDGTLGADYAIDDIRIYVQNSKVEVKQNTIPCGEDPINFDFRVRYETLSGFLSADPNDFPQPICFRICDEEGNAVTGDYDNGTNTNYGVAFAPYTFDEASDYCETDASGNQYFVFTGESGMLLDLDPEKKYYVSVAIPQGYTKEETVVEVETIVDGETIVTQKTVTTYTCTFASDDVWGNPSKICSMYSRVFQPLKQYMKLSVGGSVISSINISCGKRNTDEAFGANKYSIAGQLQIPDKSTGGFITVNDTELCPFDWYVEVKGGDANLDFTTNLKNALKRFRTVYPTATSLQEANGVFTTDDYNLLNLAITRGAPNNTNGKLYLYNGTNVLVGPNYVVGNTYIITAIPIKEKIVYQEKPYEVCPEPMEVTVEARLNGPELKLGFNDVLYPSTLPQGANVLRVGLAQLKNMRENGVPLHLPVYGYKDMNKGQENPLLLDEFGLMLVDTNDPTWDEYLNTDMWVDAYRLATGLKPNENLHEITAENNSVELYFHENWHTVKELEWWNNSWVNTVDTKRPIEFHEGYWYEVSFRYIDQTEYVSKSPSQRCYGEAYFTIKIVPEYVTWGEGLPNNSNWLNDENWSRSNVEELYKTTTNSDDYKNNAKIDERLENKGFVPMKFSKVTILGGISTPYPYLYNLEKDYHSGILKRTTNGDNSVATTDIEYDMMVKIEPEYCPNETDETNNVKVYECEKFYGNECEQIYFKPGAQLRYQHYLAYNRAWVDFELETDQWYMLTSPLSNLYAGDMFVPAKNSLDYFGRQETEAFQEIAFKGLADDNGIYSRTKYPIYQRSWDRVSSLVVTPKDDQRAPEYDAFIDYTDEDWANSEMNVVFSQWSHVYNELDEEYIPGMGFSIKAHKEKQTEKALIRLPKNDTEYTYYSYDDKPGEIKASLSNRVDDAQYKLATKDIVTGIFTVNPHDHDGECDYYQVGNPYMASMNMDLFFNQNMHLERKYWTIVSGVLHTVDGSGSMGYVGPMQSFFVKAIDGGVVESVTFSPYMTVSSNAVNTVSEGESGQMLSFTTRATANVPMAQTRVVLSAEADNGFVDEEDVETLLDSNLEDVPMVYTVAGTQAAMVNRLNDVTLLPLGLFGAEGETVDVQVHGVDRFSQTLYFYDASTGKQTALEEGTALSLEANVHGRYFLTTRALEDDAVTDDTDWQVRAYSLQRGELIVASMPQDNLRQVRIYGVNGHQVVNDAAVQSHVATYALPSGIYVAEVVTERLSRPQVVKVVVR